MPWENTCLGKTPDVLTVGYIETMSQTQDNTPTTSGAAGAAAPEATVAATEQMVAAGAGAAAGDDAAVQPVAAATGVATGDAARTRGRHSKTVGANNVLQDARGDVYIARISPVSALKVGIGFAVALFIVWMLAMTGVWFMLEQVGVWDRLNGMLSELFGVAGFGAPLYFGIVGLLGVLEMVIFVLLAPLGAIIYNNGEKLFGGLRVQLKAK